MNLIYTILLALWEQVRMVGKKLKYGCFYLLALFILPAFAAAQSRDLAAIYTQDDQTVSHLLLSNNGGSFSVTDAFKAQAADLAQTHTHLSVSGDFTGDGLDEIALFEELPYTPNRNPSYTRSVVRIMRSMGDYFLPLGSWFSMPDTSLDLSYVKFTVAGDYNSDGKEDIALFYNDPSSDELDIFVLESSGSDFLEARSWFSCDRNDFNFTALKFACPGDFNGNGFPNIAVFYNYFGTAPETRQSIFLFESGGASFDLLPVAFESTKAQYNFSDMKFALAGEFNTGDFSDLAVCMSDPLGVNTLIPVFEGSATGQFFVRTYYQTSSLDLNLSDVVHCASLNKTEDATSDLALFYDNPGSGNQEILLMENDMDVFKDPVVVYTENPGSMPFSDLAGVVSGLFTYQPVVRPARWKEDHKGALSFTFDDGYKGAFTHGGAELEAAGLRGSFFIFSDTTLSYVGELAGTSLVREYKQRGHEIGSHSSNHSDLGWLSANGAYDSLSQVLEESFSLLNERFDQHTLSISIPFGSFRPGTLDSISNYFLSARSSQQGFNLATPYDIFALKSKPVLSTTSPSDVDELVAIAEAYGYYLPLMYHDMTDLAFDEQVEIYTYDRGKFRETLQLTELRNVWIDTHQNIMKYIQMRNALKIENLDLSGAQEQPGSFSFTADVALTDSLFNTALTLKIRIPDSWTEDSARVESGDQYGIREVLDDAMGAYIYYNWIPGPEHTIHVYEGSLHPTRLTDAVALNSKHKLEAFPNPFTLGTHIRISGPDFATGSLILRDIQGRYMKEIPILAHKREIYLQQELSPGIYILQLLDSGVHMTSLRLIVQ